MLRTEFCYLFDLDAPILQAAIWPATSPELAAAVSNGSKRQSTATAEARLIDEDGKLYAHATSTCLILRR